jgi:CubicO group peptidase (beta-lactamase class C family)
MRHLLVGSVVAAALAIPACAPPATDAPAADPGVALGTPDSLLFWRGEQQLAGYRGIDEVFPTRVIEAGDDPYPLPSRPVDFSQLTFTVGADTFDLERFIEHNSIVGLLVIKDGAIALERYERGNAPDTKWVSYSISKSVVSMLVGAAIRDGYIEDLDVSVTEYLPVLEGSAYEPVTIRDALQMASGVQWSDGYDDPDSDINRSLTSGTLALLEDLGARERVAEPGERFNYNTGETHLLATLLRAAIGNNLSTYLSSEIWRPFGMESDANWMLVEPDGGEHGGCCFSATLRDYGRLGLFAMNNGVLPNGERVLADGWMQEATQPSAANPGYGYLWWLQDEGAYAAIGIFGQMIWIDPEESLVVVTHSAWPSAVAHFGPGYAFARAVREVLSG